MPTRGGVCKLGPQGECVTNDSGFLLFSSLVSIGVVHNFTLIVKEIKEKSDKIRKILRKAEKFTKY